MSLTSYWLFPVGEYGSLVGSHLSMKNTFGRRVQCATYIHIFGPSYLYVTQLNYTSR